MATRDESIETDDDSADQLSGPEAKDVGSGDEARVGGVGGRCDSEALGTFCKFFLFRVVGVQFHNDGTRLPLTSIG